MDLSILLEMEDFVRDSEFYWKYLSSLLILYFWSIFVFLEIEEGSKSYYSIFYLRFT